MITPVLNPALLHLDADHLWLMHCSDGPVPRAVNRAVRTFLHQELWPWGLDWEGEFLGIPAALRQEAARLIGAEAADLSLTTNTSTGLLAVAQGYPWRTGDEVLLPAGEFPSNVQPWKALAGRGVQVREAALWEGHKAGVAGWESTPPGPGDDPEARLIDALSPKARVLAVSWVRFQDGLKLDLARLGSACRRRGIHLVVDGIQGAGTHLPSLYGVSAFAAGGHKGMLGPQGQGLLWTEAGFRRQLAPCGTWLSLVEPDPSQDTITEPRPWVEDGRRLEPGAPSVMACAGLLESLRALNEVGVEAISAHVRALQAALLEQLAGAPGWADEVRRLRGLLERDRLGPILAFHHGPRTPADMQDLLERGRRRGVYASVREGYLRIAFHGWHEEADLRRIVDWLRS